MYTYAYAYIYICIRAPDLGTLLVITVPPWVIPALSEAFGYKWMSEVDSERHFAPDCVSRMLGSSSGSPNQAF